MNKAEFIKKWRLNFPDVKHFESDLDEVLSEIAKDAWREGYDNTEYPPSPAFDEYWKSVTDK